MKQTRAILQPSAADKSSAERGVWISIKYDPQPVLNSGVVANLELGERWMMEGPKVLSEARSAEGGGVWGGAP